MEWLKNLSNAIEYIEDNLDKEISYEESRFCSLSCGLSFIVLLQTRQ